MISTCSAFSISIFQTEKIYRHLKMQEKKISKPTEDVRTNSGLNSVKRFNMLQILEIFVECTMASNNLYDQFREISPL